MNDKQFQAAISKAFRLAHASVLAADIVIEESIRRYDVSPSDIDADGIIDCINYGLHNMTVQQFKEEIEDARNMTQGHLIDTTNPTL